MISSLPSALTLTEIGRRLGEPPHRIRYVIRSRGLRPSKRAGHCGTPPVVVEWIPTACLWGSIEGTESHAISRALAVYHT